MDRQKKILRLGAAVVALAITLRLLGGGLFSSFFGILETPEAMSLLVYLQTGRVVRFRPDMLEATQPQPTQPTQTSPVPEDPVRPSFSEADLENISVLYRCDYRPELEPLLTAPLHWNLMGSEPTVLIVHTHATESYQRQPGEDYEENDPYRTLDDRYNMVSIGDEVARVLEAGGIKVLHDRSYHDYPSYNGSYGNARVSIEEYLQRYPSIQMVLDIHRDASDGADGSQLTTAGTVAGQPSAQLMVVVGTDEWGNYHPYWQENLATGLKLTALLERQNPGITRPLTLRSERFNMDLTRASLLIEVGAAGDTHEQAVLAANALAQGILELAQGT